MLNPSEAARLAETWRRTLSGISTVLGRLAYLASLRSLNTGTYEHFGLAQRVGEEEVDRLLRRSHMDVFYEWLSFDLSRQKEDLDTYFSELPGDKRDIVANWLSLDPYAGWVPAETRDVERDLFDSDLELLLDLIRSEYGVASRDPDL